MNKNKEEMERGIQKNKSIKLPSALLPTMEEENSQI